MENKANIAFMKDVLAVFEKHGLALVPTYEGEVSFHDPVAIIKLNDSTREYLKHVKEEFFRS